MNTNPWIQQPDADTEPSDDGNLDGRVLAPPAPTGPPAPHSSVPAPRPADCFPRRELDEHERTVQLWWVGVHGGAGESTLEQLLEGSRAAGHAWPITTPDLPPARVVLVARTHARGLRAVQLAATEWASGVVAVRLEGLVLLADAPGRLPKPLKELGDLVAGGVPMVWRVPWVEAWRRGEPVSGATTPNGATRLLEQLRTPSPATTESNQP